VAVTFVDVWSLVTETTLTIWVAPQGLSTATSNVRVRTSPGRKVRFVARTGGPPPETVLVVSVIAAISTLSR